MNQEAAFLQALREAPLDDLPRLAYADWLDERDDPRGNYLRIEVELSRLSEDSADYAAREAELQSLRETIEPEWLEQAGKRYDLLLRSYPAHFKISVIKAIRELTGCGLKEGKDLSEKVRPVVVLEAVSRLQAEAGREHLRYAGGRQIAEAGIAVSGTSPLGPPPGPGPYAVYLRSYDFAYKIAVIKVIRELTGCGLKEAKDLSEAAPPVLLQTGLTWEQAEIAQRRFHDFAVVEIHSGQGAPPAPAAPAGEVNLPATGTSFDLLLQGYRPTLKINTIKVIRELTGCGLKEAKDLSEAPRPVVLQSNLSREQAARALGAFAGIAEVTVRAR